MTQATSADRRDTGGAHSGRGRPGYGRGDVIRIAVDEFNTRGYEATSMGALATRLGVSKSAIYHHVTSKEEILVEATNRALEALNGVVEEAEAMEGSARDRLGVVIGGSALTLCEYPEYVTLLLRLRGNTEVEVELMERRRQVTRRLIDHVRQAQEEGAVRSDLEAGIVGRLVFGMINSIVEWYRPDGGMAPEEISEVVSSLVFRGLETR